MVFKEKFWLNNTKAKHKNTFMKKESEEVLPCPCKSSSPYANCCKPFHQGLLPDNALKLMRSRYSAYALCLPEYIIQTTHPANPQFNSDIARWAQNITDFCLNTQFVGLEILQFQEDHHLATVTFVAHLTQDNKDVSFTEKSYFEKKEGKWLYLSGAVS